jgi:tetratricopeptide (TPR) repeat protein
MKPNTIAFHLFVGTLLLCLSAGSASAQDLPTIPDRASADTNSAVIEGRVTLPSGFAADRNVKITLRNSQMTLFTVYSNKHGEFRFHDLSEGIYYVQAEIAGSKDADAFEPTEQRIVLGRGITWEVTLQLREKTGSYDRVLRSRVVSAAEMRQTVPAPAKKEYEIGLKFVSKGDVPQASSHFKDAIALYPDYLAARNDLGAQCLKLKRVDEAEEHFLQVLEKDEKNLYARYNLGLVRVERKDYANAIAEMNRAIAIDSSFGPAHLWMGVGLLETGDLPGAERELTRALIIGGQDCLPAHYHLARAYLMRGDPNEALRAVRSYLEESPRGEYAKEAKELARKLESEVKRPKQ